MGKEGKDGNSAFRKERGSVSDIVLRDGRKGGGRRWRSVPSDEKFLCSKDIRRPSRKFSVFYG